MKKFLLYVMLPGIILGMVYSMGRSAGERSRPMDASQFPVTQVDTSQAAAPTRNVPAAIDSPVNAPVMPQRSVSQRSSAVPVAKPSVERYQVRQSPKVIETDNAVVPVEYTAPALNEPYPAPKRSVYDRRSPSELGLMPLTPLQPLAEQRVSPAPIRPAMAPQVQTSAQVYRSVRPAAAKPVVDCDCGKAH